MTTSSGEVTQLLAAWCKGDPEAEEALISRIYSELRRIAGAHLARERNNHTLQPTALANEAYLRLIGQNQVDWRSRAHFFAIASNMMRRILVDHARSARYAKRGGDRVRVTLGDLWDHRSAQPLLVLEIDEQLVRLAERDEIKAKVVELRFFGGLTEKETAEALGCSARTVTRHWRTARAWLLKSLGHAGT